MKAIELMQKEVFTCKPDDTLHEAAGIMLSRDRGSLPVVDEERHVIGMITDRDICMCSMIEGGALSKLPVSRAMSKEVWNVRPEDTLDDVLATMKTHQIRRVPVVDARKKLVGIIGLADLAGAAVDKKKSVPMGQVVQTFLELTHSRGPVAQAVPAR